MLRFGTGPLAIAPSQNRDATGTRKSRKTLFAATLAVLCAASASQATQLLASSPIYGGSAQNNGVCYITNVGGTSVPLSAPFISNQTGPVTLAANGCGQLLGAGKTCTFYADVDVQAYSCGITVGNAGQIRASFDLRSVVNTIPLVLAVEPLR